MILHTSIVGKGEPVVFLHTGLQTGEIDFSYQREYFKGNYKVILLDLRGHGKSKTEHLEVLNYLEESAVDLKETLDHLHIEKAHIVGVSLGALVGLVFAKRFPVRVISLTLSGIVSEKPLNWEELQAADVEMQNAVLNNMEAVNYFDNLHTSDWKSFITMTQDRDWYPFDETADVSGILCPSLLIVGEGNPQEVKGVLNYPEMNENFHVAVVPFASHLVHSEQSELYSMIVGRFFDGLKERSHI